MPLSPDVRDTAQKCINIGLPEQAGIPGKRVLEHRQCQSAMHHLGQGMAVLQPVQNAGSKGVACANAINNPGNHHLVGLDGFGPPIDTR